MATSALAPSYELSIRLHMGQSQLTDPTFAIISDLSSTYKKIALLISHSGDIAIIDLRSSWSHLQRNRAISQEEDSDRDCSKGYKVLSVESASMKRMRTLGAGNKAFVVNPTKIENSNLLMFQSRHC